MKKLMNWLKNEESGQGMVEYGLIIVLIALVAALTLGGLGTKIGEVFKDATTKLANL